MCPTPTRAVSTSRLPVRRAAGFEEAFVRELEGFHDTVVGAAPRRNTVEDARRDARLLAAVARKALAVDAT